MPPKDIVDQISRALKAEGILTPNVLAYALATMKAEGNFQSPREGYGRNDAESIAAVTNLYNRGKISNNYALPDKKGKSYYGRGFIQLTHKGNYEAMGKRLGIDLVNNPDLALQPDIAAKILAAFFKDRGVAEAADRGDFIGARRPVNGSDRAGEIANYANSFAQQAQQGVLGASTEPQYNWSTKMQTNDGKTMILNNQTGMYDNLEDIVNPPPRPAQDLRLKKSLLDIILDYITPKAGASYDPTNPGGIRNYSYAPQSRNNWNQIKGYSGSPSSLQVGQQLQIPQKTISYARPTPSPQQNYTPSNANYSSQASGGPAYSAPPASRPQQNYSQPVSQPSARLNFSPSKPSGQAANNAAVVNKSLTTKSGLRLTI